MMDFKLTNSQQSAIAAFRKFLEGPEQVFMLKGAAGTGKTTLVSEFVNILKSKQRELGIMAPTGRGAFVIGKKTGTDALTIHRGIYSLSELKSISQNKEEEDDGGLHYKFALRVNDDSNKAVYIVDEASMISDQFSEQETFSFGSGCLLTDFFEFARGRKIVLVGDYAQLPPVGMNFSPALDKEYLEEKFDCKVTEIMLREVMRQSSGSVMLSNAAKLRDSIENKTFVEFKLDEGDDSALEDVDLLIPYYQLYPSKPGVKSAIIAYSNKQALDYNLDIRRHYYGKNVSRLITDDLLMVCRNNYAYEHELFNGNIVQVEATQPDNEVIQHSVRVKIRKNHVENVDLKFRRVTIKFAVEKGSVSLNVMILDNFLDDPSNSVGGLLARALIVDFNNRLPEFLKSRRSEIRRLLRSNQELTVEQQELCDTYLDLLRKDPYYNAVICKYGYAMTCHKAQGGEWENVFVDMCRYGGTANEDYFRWAYTAITRSSKKIWYFHSPDFNYISNLVVNKIIMSSNIRVSCYAESEDFCGARFRRIESGAQRCGLSVSEDRTKAYQHLITFTDGEMKRATFQLWYNDNGYSGRDILTSSDSEELSALCIPIIEASFAPEDVPFSAPDRPFAEKLVKHVRSQIDELGIKLLNITQEAYQDVFHLKTDGLAKIMFTYSSKGDYTYMSLVSSLGSEDTKLKALRERFI